MMMSRGLKLVICILVFAYAICGPISVGYAATWTVGPTPDYDFQTIQNAVDAADPGDTIEVYPGDYDEDVVVFVDKENITLLSVDKHEVFSPPFHRLRYPRI